MKTEFLKKQKLHVLIAGLLPIILAAVVAVMYIMLANAETHEKNQQRAADGVNNAAQNLEWMLESGVEKLGQASEFTSGADDADELIQMLASQQKFINIGVAQRGVIRYPDGKVMDDLGYDKFPNCTIGGMRVNMSESEQNGVQLRLSLDEKMDLVCLFEAADLDHAIADIYDGKFYYAVYNVRTGSYLYNNLPFEGASYYDALMTINRNGSGEALFAAYRAQAYFSKLIGGEGCIVAQQPTEISPWGLAIVLPENLFEIESSGVNILFIIIGAAIFLQIVFAALFLAYVLRKGSKSEKRLRILENAADRKLALSVEYTGVCVFEYNRGLGRIVDFHDGMAESTPEMQLRPKTINEFVAYYKPNDDDALRLYEVFAEIRAGEVANVDVHAFANEGERLLRFRLHCLESGSGSIIGSVRDCTQDEFSQTRIEDEEKFLELMKPKSSAIWDVSVTRNQWKISYDKRGTVRKRFGINLDTWVGYEEVFTDKMREYLHPADTDNFLNIMSVGNLMNMYRSGNTEFVYECRVRRVGKEGYEWHRQMLRIFRDPATKAVMARVYVLNVDAEKNAEMERRERQRIHQQTLTAIGGIYYGLYYIELDNDLCYTAKSHAGELGSDICGPFHSAFSGYIDQFVHEGDKDMLRRMIDPYLLRREILEEQQFKRCEFRRKVGENFKWSAAIIQAARFENAQVRDVVLAFEDISDSKPMQ